MRRGLTSVLAVVLIAAAAAGLYWFEYGRGAGVSQPAVAQGAPSAPVPVEVTKVAVGTVAEQVEVIGALRSNESVNVSSEIAGIVSAIHFTEGEPVEAGKPLFQLDDTIYRAELAEAVARLALSQRNYQRAVELLDKNVGSVRTRDEALAELETARAALGLARARLGKTEIKAPFAGVLGLRKVSVGEYITPGQELVNLENMEPIKVDFRIAERYLPKLQAGQLVKIMVDSLPDRDFAGKVTAIDPKVEPDSRSVAVRAQVPNPEGLLRPGQFARIFVVVEERAQALLVPEQAVLPRGGDTFVFKVVDGKAVLAKVRIGQRRDGQAEVVAGLTPEDVVVTGGLQKIREGGPVKPIEADGVS